MSNLTTRNILVAIDVGNCIFLALCFYLLISSYRRREQESPQQLYLVNLAASEILANILLVVRDIINIIRPLDYLVPSILHTTFWCLNMAFVTGVSYIYILARFFVTGDRLLHICLHAKYARYWYISKTWKLIIITWMCNLVISISLSLFTYFNFNYVRYEANISKIMAVYVLTFLHIIFLIFAFFTYFIMFMKYARSKRNSTQTFSNSVEAPLLQIFINSRFFISLVLISTYLILTVIPSLTRTIHYLAGYKVPYSLTFSYLISTRLSYTVDGCIYTFLQKSVRDILLAKISCQENVPLQSLDLTLGQRNRSVNHNKNKVTTTL